jgi:DNA-binding NarL/FixJ family response regulator
VVVVAGTRLYREGLARALDENDGLAVVAAVSRRKEELERLDLLGADIVVLDIDSREGLNVLNMVRALTPARPIVVLGAAHDEDAIVACAECGVSGYVEDEAGVAELAEVVHAAVRGELLCSPQLAGTLLRRIGKTKRAVRSEDPLARLTRRERQVLDLLEDGLSNKEIGQSLHIEVATVKVHVHNVLDKLEISRRTQAASRHRQLEASSDVLPEI